MEWYTERGHNQRQADCSEEAAGYSKVGGGGKERGGRVREGEREEGREEGREGWRE